MQTKTRCRECGEEKKLAGRGLCPACYHRERRRRMRIPLQGMRQSGEFLVSIDFEPMACVLEEVKKRAGAELRDVPRQILWELGRAFGVQS